MGRRGEARGEGPWSDLALHTIGWKAFQDLCSQVCQVVLRTPVQVYREARDGGQDAVFLARNEAGFQDATIQCKHSSDAGRRLRRSDVAPELSKVEELVSLGQAHAYYLMTSMGVDAPVAERIRADLRKRGVAKPYVLGREWLIKEIRSSAHLRALVPQVYGLGDLGALLDERMARRTKLLLDHWLPKLRPYVSTEAHRRAVAALGEHRAVLLLGNPSAGKSTIGAILSTIASEDADHTVLHLTSPRDFENGWDPSDRKRFFWIDDAFGANIMRDEYVQDWASTFRKVEAAIGYGNRFLLTSRRHIYERARPLLGQRNLAAFADWRAVVDVGDLTDVEKAQILYNHIAFGSQSQEWKRAVKPHLDAVAKVPGFLPGVAERLGDPVFTRGTGTSRGDLMRFMSEPRTHLVDTVRALDAELRAALILIYVHEGNLTGDQWGDEASAAAASSLGVQLAGVRDRMPELAGSFVVSRAGGGDAWSYAHPTIADALTDILAEKPHMVEALLRGIRPESILTGFVSEGAAPVPDAGVIPASMNVVVASRIVGIDDASEQNRSLISFLASRASDDLLGRVLDADPAVLDRRTWRYLDVATDPRIRLLARVHALGRLPEQLRDEAATRMERAALDDFDLSFLDRGEMLALIAPERILVLGLKLRMQALPKVGDMISETADGADPDEDPEGHFQHFEEGFETLGNLAALDTHADQLVEDAREIIEKSVQDLQRRKEEKDAEELDENDAPWSLDAPPSAAVQAPSGRAGDRGARSVFTDVDEH